MVQKAVKPIKSVKVKAGKTRAAKAVNTKAALDEYEKIAQARFRIAMGTYEKQDGLTKEVLDRIRDRLTIATTGVVNINGVPTKLYASTVECNTMFLAVDILNDLAINGIRVANFKPNPMYCAECKKQILGVNNPRSKR